MRVPDPGRGVWSRAEALQSMTRGQIDARLRSGAWHAPWPGVLARGGDVPDVGERAVAAVLGSGGLDRAVACGRTAARMWAMPLVDDRDPACERYEHLHDHVSVERHLPALRRGSRVLHRHELELADEDVWSHPCGVRLTSPVRTLFDCAVLLRHDALVCALDDALHRRLATREELEMVVVRRWGEVGCPAFRHALDLADARAESPSETVARLLLLPALPGLVPQVELRDATGLLVARFDLGDEDARLAIELDGRRGHAGDDMVAKDRRRDRVTDSYGWTTERFTWFDLRRRPVATQAYLVARRARLAAARHAA